MIPVSPQITFNVTHIDIAQNNLFCGHSMLCLWLHISSVTLEYHARLLDYNLIIGYDVYFDHSWVIIYCMVFNYVKYQKSVS